MNKKPREMIYELYMREQGSLNPMEIMRIDIEQGGRYAGGTFYVLFSLQIINIHEECCS